MKPLTPHNPLDDLIAAALHGELTPEERAQFESRLTTDPAAQAAYQEAQAMHDLLEKTHKNAQPDPAFEQRMVSGVRRKLQTEQQRETAWESLLVMWKAAKSVFGGRSLWIYGGASSLVLVLCLAFVIYRGNQVKGVFSTISSQLALAQSAENEKQPQNMDEIMDSSQALAAKRDRDLRTAVGTLGSIETARNGLTLSGYVDNRYTSQFAGQAMGYVQMADRAEKETAAKDAEKALEGLDKKQQELASADDTGMPSTASPAPRAQPVEVESNSAPASPPAGTTVAATATTPPEDNGAIPASSPDQVAGLPAAKPSATPAPPAIDTRKLIRNAQLDLEVKSFQAAMDQITALTRAAGGYVDTSNSQRGGNGKLQGTVVVKVLPQNLDGFLFKLRDLGEVQNQSVSTDDVTKDYFDTQARLVNSQKMETQLQELLKRENGKVSDLLAVERELGRVRGDIEQMQGQLKLYDFQVEYATVTMNLSEKDLNQAAAYLLKEQDDFSLFATDVEGTFQKARQSADDFKAQVLVANLVHNSGTDVAAELTVMVAPDQIEPFLAQVRGLGRVANFTRQTQRVAKDGGDSTQPADETKTEKDKVQVHLAIRSDDETRKQVALTVVAKAVDDALDQAKTAALANAGTEILNSSLNKTPQGQSTAQLTVRVPGSEYAALIAAFNGLGRTASLSIQRNDNSGPGTNGDDAPVIVSLSLTDDDQPLQQTQLSVVADDVDGQSQQIKKTAGDAGVEVKASSFERQPDGTEVAQMTFRLPMAKYPAFLESVKALGKVESLTVRRDDRPDETRTDDTAPAEISLTLHNQRDIVAENNGLWATLRQTFGDGAAALFGSIRVIGVVIAFLAPWVFTIVLLAWVGRRIYIWRKK